MHVQIVSEEEEVAWLELRLEYSGPRSGSSAGGGSPAASAPDLAMDSDLLGRRSTVPIQLRLLPSLQVLSPDRLTIHLCLRLPKLSMPTPKCHLLGTRLSASLPCFRLITAQSQSNTKGSDLSRCWQHAKAAESSDPAVAGHSLQAGDEPFGL